jgi:hypothetical protein
MNWLKENSFLTGLLAATLIVGAALVFLMTSSMTQYQETLEGYRLAVRKLQSLQNRTPFPSLENLERSRSLAEQYKSELNLLRENLAKMQAPNSPDVLPQKFQDDLRVAVNQITERAAAAGVELPKGFYLGFGQYANSLPNERAATTLARQLRVIEKVVNNLIDYKVKSIDGLNRLPLPEESAASPATPTKELRKEDDSSQSNPIGYARQPFDLAFTAEQGKLRLAFNSLLDSEYFLIVRNLAVQNTMRVGPPIARQAGASAPLSPPPTDGQTAREEHSSGTASRVQKDQPAIGTLNVILGRELVKASLRIEIIDFFTEPPSRG